MKKKFTLLIAALLAMLAYTASAAVGDIISFTYSYYNNQTMYAIVLSEEDKTAELIPNPDGVTVYNMTGNSMWITPTSANGYTIISIGENTFKNASIGHPSTYAAGLSNGFTTIKADAFNGATKNGTSISVFRINAEVSDISPMAFRNNKIKWFDFRNNEQSVGYSNLNHVLTDVAKTKIVAFPGNYVAVTGSAQLSTTSLPSGSAATSYTVPSQITTIGAYAFYGNSRLATLNLGSVTTIEEEACVNMSALKTLTIPATVTSIAANAFTGTTGITTLTVNCEWNDNLAGVVFDDAVYTRLIDNVTWNCSDASKAAFKANANWGRFFTGGGAPLLTYNIAYGSTTNGTITGPTTADNGTTVTLTVTPDAHYELGTLTVTDADNNAVQTTAGANGTYTFLMPASNVTVAATFSRIPTITIGSITNGDVTADLDEATAGTTVTLTVAPDAHYELGTLTVTDADNNAVQTTAAANGTYTFVMPPSNVTVAATFSRIPTISIGSMTNGAVTADLDEATAGTTVTLTVTPDQWYELDALTVTDADNSPVTTTAGATAGTYTFTMPTSNVTVNATFAVAHKLYLMGSFNNWNVSSTDGMVELTYDATAQTYSTRQPLADSGDGYAYFRLKDMNNQYGPSGGSDLEITEQLLDTDIPITTSHGDKAFKIAAGENFTFTVNEAKTTLHVIGLDRTPFQSGKFYYSAVSANEVEIVPNPNGDAYSGIVGSDFKATVTNAENATFTVVGFGVEALKNATFANASNSAYNMLAIEQNYPNYRYIKSRAFEGVVADGIRFYNVTQIAPDAFINNRAHGIIANVSGYTTNLTSDFTYPSNVISSIAVLGTSDRLKVLAYPGNARVNANSKSSAKVSTINAIGGNIEEIGAYAFYGNQNLTSITFGSSSKVKTIGDYAFTNSKLTTLNLPATLETIGEDAFAGVTTISSLTVNAVTPPAGGVFEESVYQRLKDQLNIPSGSEDAYRADENWGKFFSEAYTITIDNTIQNGTVTADKQQEIPGRTVTLTVTPAENYEIGTITVLNGDTPVETTKVNTTTYTFTMPEGNVIVTATFTPMPQAFIMGQVNGNNWAGNVGVPMTYDVTNKTFSATVTTTGSENGYSYFSFTRALGSDANSWPADADRFGAVLDETHNVNGNFNIASSDLNTALTMSNYGSSVAYRLPQGTWTVTISNLLNNEVPTTMTITGTWPATKYYYNAGGTTTELTVAANGTATYTLNAASDTYFNFARKLDSGTMPYTYFGTAANHDVLRTEVGTPLSLAADGTEGYFHLPAGEWTLTLAGLDTDTRTLTITGEWPNNGNVYLLGTNQGWDPTDGSLQLTYDGTTQTYSIEITAQESANAGEEGYSFFSFTRALGSWDDIAASRLGADSDQKLIEFAEGVYTTTATVQPGTNSFKIAAGEDYTLTLNYDLTQLTVATYNKDPFTDGIVYYKPINSAECEIIPHPSGRAYNISSTSSLDKTVVTNSENRSFTIVGIAEYAFQNAQFPTNGNTNMPTHIRYVKDHAFKGVMSGSSESRSSIRFYGNTLRYMSSKAFLDNKLQGSVLISSGDATNGFAQVSSDAVSSAQSGQLYLAAERGTKYFMFPWSYPIGTSSSWAPAHKVTINNEIKTIGAYAMMNCTNYTEINLSNVEVIDTAAFKNTALSTITLGSALTSIGEDAFAGATAITHINLSAATPPAVASDFEQDVYNRNNVLNLTGDAKTNELAYMIHPIWGKFFKGATLKATLTNPTDGKAYKVTDRLTVAMVDEANNTLYLADDGGADAQIPEEGWTDFMGDHLGKPYTSFSHNNWLAIAVDDASNFRERQVVTTVVGTLNAATTTLSAAAVPVVEEELGAIMPNTYIVANFAGQTQTIGEQTFFFMQPVVNEVATVTWAQYAGDGRFVVPTNASDFAGELLVDTETMTGLAPEVGAVYTLDGVMVAAQAPSAGSGMPRRAEGATGLVMKNARVYQDQSIITAINDLHRYGNVESVTYYDVAGRHSQRPFCGVNIVVTRYTDGTTSTAKVVK